MKRIEQKLKEILTKSVHKKTYIECFPRGFSSKFLTNFI